ncbi:hypothetical protein [Okeania sp. SIO2C2]|uniref:hypothetical protein n=1 Tax=Okeania sp. SIO2C2 TaxID=2607787 RepID=UPI00257CEBAD|nr:hypothetical protein [Okeania sp. SIO2C2]
MSPQESTHPSPLPLPGGEVTESGGKKAEKEEILENSIDNFSISLVLSVLSVLKFYL